MAIEKKKEPPKAAAKKAAAPAKKEEPKKPSTAVATRPQASTAMAQYDANQLMRDAQADQGTFGKDDLATPFFRVLQALSPQCQRGDEKYVDDAEAGMFIDTSDGELWTGEDGVLAVPVHYTPSFIEWQLREKGGGLVKDHGAVQPDIPTTRDEKGRDILPNGNQLVKSGLYFLFIVNPEDGSYKQVAMPLQGTQLKKSRAWNTRIKSVKVPRPDGVGEFTPAMYYMTWRITTQFEKNDKGSWYGVVIEPHKPLPELIPDQPQLGWGIYVAAKEFKEMIAAGRVKTQIIESEAEGTVEPGADKDEAY